MKKTKLFTLSLLFIILSLTGFSQQISPLLFGQNAWMPDTIGNVFFNGKLHQNWGKIQEGKAVIIRFGGIAADENRPTNHQYIKMIDSARAHGMEPVIQVPFNNYKYSAGDAAAIVTYINKTRGKNIKYWVIGNEPDLKYGFTKSSQVAAYIKAFSTAMKAVDPNIKIVGPETAWYNTNILNGLLTPGGLDDITGKDPSGRYYIDIISFHTYPFNGSQSRADVISKLNGPNQFNDNLKDLSGKIAQCNSAHGRSGASALKMAVTEANINFENPASDNVSGVGSNSYLGGQFWAEMLSICMKNGVEFINFWSVIEGSAGSATNIGFINPSDNIKKPAFYFFKMMSENFAGAYLNGTSNIGNVKAFGSKNNGVVTVMLLNQDGNDHSYTVRLNKDAVSTDSKLKINLDGGLAVEYSGTIDKESSVLVQLTATGQVIKIITYKLHGHANAGLPPEVTENSALSADELLGDDALGVYPNPAKDHLNISFPIVPASETEPELEIVNTLGQLVYKKELDVNDGQIKQHIELDKVFAAGIYIVNVTIDGKQYTKKIMFRN